MWEWKRCSQAGMYIVTQTGHDSCVHHGVQAASSPPESMPLSAPAAALSMPNTGMGAQPLRLEPSSQGRGHLHDPISSPSSGRCSPGPVFDVHIQNGNISVASSPSFGSMHAHSADQARLDGLPEGPQRVQMTSSQPHLQQQEARPGPPATITSGYFETGRSRWVFADTAWNPWGS